MVSHESARNNGIMDNNMEIDIVCLWVDGSAMGFGEKLKSRLRTSNSVMSADQAGIHRFRSNDELLYSLRSIHRYAPWVRKIHLVTDGQHPPWLNVLHEKIAIVTHRQIFAHQEDLPVFNSNAIEMNLHRIPDLARKFLYFNDDLFLGRPTRLDDFMTGAGSHIFYLEPNPLHRNPDRGPVHDRAYVYTQNVARDRWADVEPSYLPAHCPQLYDRDHLCHLERQFKEAFDKTSAHPFRSPEDLVLRILYQAFLLSDRERTKGHQSRLLAWGSPDYSFLSMGKKPIIMVRAFVHIIRKQPKFICINDDLADFAADRFILKLETYFLKKLYPEKSCFEK
jgi:hypothetical protein